MKVQSVEAVIVDLPLRRLQRFSATRSRHQSVVIVRIKTDDGVEGVGEATTPTGPWWSGDSVETIKVMIDTYLAPLVVGQDPGATTAIMRVLDEKVFANQFAKAAVEMALLDIAARRAGVPLSALFGGRQRDGLPMTWPLATGDSGQELEEAEAKLAASESRVFKFKMGFMPIEDDMVRLERVAIALGGRATLGVDPNCRWDEVSALRALGRIEACGVDLMEQPLARNNLEGMARLTSRASIAVLLDESATDANDIVRLGRKRVGTAVSLKIMKSGGMRQTQRLAHVADAVGLSLYMGTFLESSIGTAANLQFASTLDNLPYGGELLGPTLLADDLVTEPLRYVDFAVAVPTGPGIGATLDEDKLAHYRRDRLTSPPVTV